MNFLIIGLILIIALFAIRFSHEHGVSALLLFIVLGMVFSAFGIDFKNFEFADNFATIALMVIMFYGGFGTSWKMAKPVAKEAIILSSLGVVVTALFTGLFCHYVLKLQLLESMLIGSIVGSTDYASVSNILRSKNLNLKYGTASLLELESGSNDPTAYSLTMIFLSIIIGSKVSIPALIFLQVSLGLIIGFFFAFIVSKLLKNIQFQADGLHVVFMAAIILITYSTANLLGGNGYLAIYILGIYLGNQNFRGKRDVIFFFDGLTEIMQIALFFILGLLSNFSDFVATFPLAVAIMLFMTIIARPLGVYALMLPFKLKYSQLNMISLAGIRGGAAIAFAILAVNSDAVISIDIYHIVFGICLLSSLIQGSLMPISANKWNMIDSSDTVLQTFNYYQDKSEIDFLETKIRPNSPLIGKKLRDLNLTFDYIIAKIERNGKTIVPRGQVTLEENDLVIIGGETHFDESGQNLIEFTIPSGHQWENHYIKDLDLPTDRLIIMVQRKDEGTIVPVGDTFLLGDDKVIMIKVENELDFSESDEPDDIV